MESQHNLTNRNAELWTKMLHPRPPLLPSSWKEGRWSPLINIWKSSPHPHLAAAGMRGSDQRGWSQVGIPPVAIAQYRLTSTKTRQEWCKKHVPPSWNLSLSTKQWMALDQFKRGQCFFFFHNTTVPTIYERPRLNYRSILKTKPISKGTSLYAVRAIKRVPAGSCHFLCLTDPSQSVVSIPCVRKWEHIKTMCAVIAWALALWPWSRHYSTREAEGFSGPPCL